MPSALELHKLAAQRTREIIEANRGQVTFSNMLETPDTVGPFAPSDYAFLPDLSGQNRDIEYYEFVPVQACSYMGRDGRLRSMPDYRLPDHYRNRWAYCFRLDLLQYHEIRDMEDDPTREEWVLVRQFHGGRVNNAAG